MQRVAGQIYKGLPLKSKNMLSVGIIGLGIGKKHIEAFNDHPGCKVTTLCDFSEEKYVEASKEFPSMRITKEAEDVLHDPELDIISIASYDNYHYEHVLSALKNRKHVFVEKPLCLYPYEALSVKKFLGENRDIRLSSNLNLRTCPRFVRLREEVLSKGTGRIFYMEGDYFWGRIRKMTDGWRGNMEFYSIVLGAAIHMIDLLIWISGQYPLEVQGYGNQIATSGSGFKFKDFASILMKFENGMIAKVCANGGCVHPHFHRVTVFGTEKSFLHEIGGGMWMESGKAGIEKLEVKDEYPGVNEKAKIITTFIDSILDNKAEAIVPTEDVFSTMSVCFAAEKAIEEEKPIKIEYI
jgi:predicted dehydrogenase